MLFILKLSSMDRIDCFLITFWCSSYGIAEQHQYIDTQFVYLNTISYSLSYNMYTIV